MIRVIKHVVEPHSDEVSRNELRNFRNSRIHLEAPS